MNKVSETSKSYQHDDEFAELQRLIAQFDSDRQWEKPALSELGFQQTESHRRMLSYGCGSGTDIATFLREGYASYAEGSGRKTDFRTRGNEAIRQRASGI